MLSASFCALILASAFLRLAIFSLASANNSAQVCLPPERTTAARKSTGPVVFTPSGTMNAACRTIS